MAVNADGSGKPRVAVVAAGAGARGAFEAGALSVLLKWLDAREMRPTVFVGTSAGAINATLLAATADLSAGEAGEKLLAFWRSVTVRKVFRSPLRSGPSTLVTYMGQLLGRAHVVSLLDTSPLVGFAEQTFAAFDDALRNNVANGTVEALAVVATDAHERTSVFADLAPGVQLPQSNLARAIDYRPAAVGYRHVLASSAIPVLFRPIEIDGAYYTDGGVRLNVPLSPAIELGATHVVVVATHPDAYPPAPSPSPQRRPPDVIDSVASVLGSLLSDGMIEDLHTLDKLNQHADGNDVRLIPRLFVGPETRHELGALAARLYAERHSGRRAIRELDFRLAHALLGRAEKGDGDLLSYILFDEAFMEQAIQLGIKYASKTLASRSQSPWVPAVSAAAKPAGRPRPSASSTR
ncbi:MAG TPA: patatin-like phospholipase family protein [Solirubrobacteraceae bacterium]|jgi:NTE family protein|nr:patatin-like phospholipase family protein [Solirubrobacteraceae bacterium]